MADEQNIAVATTATTADATGKDGIDGSCCTAPPDDDPGPIKG